VRGASVRGEQGGGGDDHECYARLILSAYRRVTRLERNSTERSLHPAAFSAADAPDVAPAIPD